MLSVINMTYINPKIVSQNIIVCATTKVRLAALKNTADNIYKYKP